MSCAALRPSDSGIALIIAMIVLAAMALAASALMRAVDTAHAIAGNVAFRDAAVGPADAAIEEAWAALYERGAIADRGAHAPAAGYFASRMPGEDPRGVPAALAAAELSGSTLPRLDLDEGYVARYAIERMCVAEGPTTPANCALVRATSRAAPLSADPGAAEPMAPLLRVSVRVDGPRGTLMFVQATIRDASPPRRIAWRMLAE